MALTFVVCLLVATSAAALEKRAFRLKDDLGMEPLSTCVLQYYYYIPCPTYSWFWWFSDWELGDIIGAWFEVGDMSTGGFDACDPTDCHMLDDIRVAHAFGGWCQGSYPGSPVEFNVYCADEYGCPIGPSQWREQVDLGGIGWQYIQVDPPISICDCTIDPGPPPSQPRILVTATMVRGAPPWCAEWACDNISSPLEHGCNMHDYGSMPVLYPRPHTGYYSAIHSGIYGHYGVFEHCPPLWFKDGRDTTPGGTQYGFVELCWRIYLTCSGPTKLQPATWGRVKSLYK